MNKGHRWTREEEELIITRYDSSEKSALILANRIGVSAEAIRRKACYLGVSRVKRAYNLWTAEQEETLRELLGKGMTYNEIAVRMKLSRNSIVKKKRNLGLGYGNSNREDTYTQEEAGQILGFSQHRINQLLTNGRIKGKYNGNKWIIDKTDIVNFVRRYPDELTGRNVDIVQLVDLLVGIWTCDTGSKERSLC